MIFTSVAQADRAFPELKLPVIVLGMRNHEICFAAVATTKADYLAAANAMMLRFDLRMVVASEHGDNPRGLSPVEKALSDDRAVLAYPGCPSEWRIKPEDL